MNNDTQTRSSKKAFVAPQLHELDVKGTETGPTSDPSEFPGILQMS